MILQLYNEKNIRQLKAILLKFRHNSKGFWSKYRFLIILLIIGAVLDCISTCHFMSIAGVHRELHPYILLVSCYLGPFWGPIVGKSAQLLIGLPVIIFIRKYAYYLLGAASFLYFTASFFNFFVIGVFDSILVFLLKFLY